MTLTLALGAVWSAGQAPREDAGGVDFAREVYPILKGSCFDCHGPQKQRGGLRLDSLAAVLKGGDGGPALVPGSAGQSELLRRVRLPREDDEAMPAIGAGLDARQVATLERWIEQGAAWPADAGALRHWAYVPPVRPAPPPVAAAEWVRNPVDAFVLARLEQEGLTPAAEAEPAALVRRLHLDLVGLPPTPAEVDAFLADRAPDAYERLVERLLASPQFGVRWARPWLDCARYADSHGYQADNLRDLWAYRDWVVDALNADMPFDRFTVEQLAGDLLPEPTLAQLVATGFNRCAPTNVELGSDPVETRVNQVIDRVNTVATVWMGTTMDCAQCHDHKYDPFTQRDYYGLFAFFDDTAIEAERRNALAPGSIEFLGPYLELPDPEVDAARAAIEARLAEVVEQLELRRAELARPDPGWEAALRASLPDAPREHVLAVEEFTSLAGAYFEVLADGSLLLSGEVPDRDTYTVTVATELRDIRAFKLEALTDPSLPGSGPGRANPRRPTFQLNALEVEGAPADGSGPSQPVSFVRATASHSLPSAGVDAAIDGDPESAWSIGPRVHRPHWAVFECAEPQGFAQGSRFVFRLVQDFGSGRLIGRFRLSALVGAPGHEGLPVAVAEALARPEAARGPEERAVLLDHRLRRDERWDMLDELRMKLEARIEALRPPTTLVMREDTPRETRLLIGGDFRNPGEPVAPALPGIFPALAPRPRAEPPEDDSPGLDGGPDDGSRPAPDRLDLARWLVSPANPLVARVTVNRWWSELFGRGLVATPEDFGTRGEAPTHPELLDWLAVELVENGWSRKGLLRTLVLSAAYRQSADAIGERRARDPDNLLLARGAAFRMEAERIHDNALAIAGLLETGLGGPPIYPPRPPGLWNKVGGEVYEYEVSPAPERYRRALYVVLRRSFPHPAFANFDATPRMTCQVKRARSNTALQALTLLNDPVHVEAAAAFALRILRERPMGSPGERVEHAFRLALARAPEAAEREALVALHGAQLAEGAPDSARLFAAAQGAPPGLDPREFTAWYAVAAALLNLDETITR